MRWSSSPLLALSCSLASRACPSSRARPTSRLDPSRA
jgi:hypothetical protein